MNNHTFVAVSALGSVYSKSCPSQLKTAVQSLLIGCSSPLEIVLVVDGYVPPELKASIESVAALPSTKIIYLPSNLGLGQALSAGLKHVSGEIIVRFDTDDVNISGRINTLTHTFNINPKVDIIGSYVYEFSSATGTSLPARIKKVPLSHDNIVWQMNFANPINHPSVAFRSNVISRIGGYEDCKLFEDYLMWLKCRKLGLRFLNLPAPLVCMRRASLFERRSGLAYFICEISFVAKAINRKYISLFIGLLFLLRALIRLVLPKIFMKVLMTQARSGWVEIGNPDNV